MVLYSKMRPFCRQAIVDMPRSLARDFSCSAFCQECTAGLDQVTSRHFVRAALCKAIASPWIGCSSSARGHLVRNTFGLLQGIAALHLQFRCMIQMQMEIQMPSLRRAPLRAPLGREARKKQALLPTVVWLRVLLILLMQRPFERVAFAGAFLLLECEFSK